MAGATIRWGAWFDDEDLLLDFPEGWNVERCEPHDAPDMTPDAVAAAIASPIGTPRLAELAERATRPCVVIDDLSRPTRGHLLVPPILDELAAAGIAAEDVLILGGVANHRPMVRGDLLKKLGADVIARCRYRNHFSWDNCTFVGETSAGSPVEINTDFLACDLRILVGSIIPHGGAGFSGGAKMLFPGIASARSGLAYHRGSAARGSYDVVESEARLESEEAARMVGVDFLVNMVPTSRLGVAAVVAGDVVDAHRVGVERAREVFATPTPSGVDACVLSLYPKDTEFLQHVTAFAPWKTAAAPIVREGGSVVVALSGSEGLGSHSLFGPGMQLAGTRATRLRGRELAFFCPNVERGEVVPLEGDGPVLFTTWDETRAWLESRHGERASVAVFPCATMQLAG